MAKRRKEKKTYRYECTLTGESYILTEKAQNPDELVSVEAWYEMHPEKEDRPENIKKEILFKKPAEEAQVDVEEQEE